MEEYLKSLTQVVERQTKILDAMQKQQNQMHQKSVASQGTYTELHGNGSLWGFTSIERDVISAHMTPQGLAPLLPLFPTVEEDPRFGILTGYTDTTGSEPTNPCDNAPTGYVKGCTSGAVFGRLMRDTQTIDIDRVMLRKNRGDFTDLVLHGRIFGDTGLQPGNLDESGILNVVTKSEMVIVGVNMERKLSQVLWQGSTANNTAGGGYKEFPGLDSQIATGHVDWETNTACPAVDSDVKDFAYDLVGGSGRDIVEYLSMLEFYLNYNARSMGLDPVRWVVVMRPELWFELSAVWPCSYLSHRCTTDGSTNPIVINDNANVSMRDAMRNGLYIDINGNRYPVVTDTGIFEHTNVNNANVPAGSYASTIYMVPLTIANGLQVTYRQHLDYRQAAPDIALLRGKERFWTDNGVYMWGYEDASAFCYKLKAKTEQRVILRTPHLAGRIDSVRYTPLQHLRSPYPADPYFQDGGVSQRADTAPGYAVWLS